MCDLVMARSSALVAVEGRQRLVPYGAYLCADDPRVAAAPDLFEAAPVEHYCKGARRGVEQATAAPGEKRQVAPKVSDGEKPPRRKKAD